MGEVLSGTEGESSVLQGTEDDDRQPDKGTGDDKGQPTDANDLDDSQNDGEPDGKGTGEEVTAEQLAALEKDHRNLQKAFNKRDEELSTLRAMEERLSRMGGVDSIEQAYNYINSDPDFLKLLQDKQRKESGDVVDFSEYDEETQKALGLVDKVASKRDEFMLKQIKKFIADEISDRVEPLAEKERIREATSHIAKMDKQYPKWREMQEKMDELIDDLPESVQNNPSFSDIKYLYFTALEEEGKYDDYAAERHAEKLKKLKKESSDGAPSSTVQRGSGKAKNLREALAMAEKEHNIKL